MYVANPFFHEFFRTTYTSLSRAFLVISRVRPVIASENEQGEDSAFGSCERSVPARNTPAQHLIAVEIAGEGLLQLAARPADTGAFGWDGLNKTMNMYREADACGVPSAAKSRKTGYYEVRENDNRSYWGVSSCLPRCRTSLGQCSPKQEEEQGRRTTLQGEVKQ